MAQSQYATTAQIQLLAITPAAFARFEAASPGCVTAALQAASSLADDYLGSQFKLPLQISPQGWDMSLTEKVCWVAAYSLYFNFGFNPSSPDWQVMTERRKEALAWLDSVGKKTITPNYTDSSGLDPDADRAGDFVISDSPVGFTSRGSSNTVPLGTCGWWW
jgi:phage gp36-like protein